MSYRTVLEKAGYEVLDYEIFGYYQGDWAAILKSGEIIKGHYGSCSGCDALKSYLHYEKNVEDMTKKECIKFLKDYGLYITKDYKEFLVKSKWDSDHNELANWCIKRLVELGFMEKEVANDLKTFIGEEDE